MVESIVGVDQPNNLVYFTGTETSPLERHLYSLPLMGTTMPPPLKLTTERGMHHVVMSHNHRLFVDMASTPDAPPKVRLYALDAPGTSAPLRAVRDVHDAMDDRVKALAERLTPPELFSFQSCDGADELFGALYRPKVAEYGPGPYPTIVAVYGGPHVQRVSSSWGMAVDMRAQWLCALGFCVLKCDNRGSSRRGLHFEGAVKNNMGELEVSDQEDAVNWAVAKGITDPQRVGMYGWSYGGYMSAMSLCKLQDQRQHID